MSWGKTKTDEKRKRTRKHFVPSNEITEGRMPKKAIWGPPGGGKTYHCGTLPSPVYIFDLEVNVTPVLKANFRKRWEAGDYIIGDVIVPDSRDDLDPVATFEEFKDATMEIIDFAKDEPGKIFSVVLDSGTVIYEMLQDRMDILADIRYKKGKMAGKPMRTEYGKYVRREYYNMLLHFISRPNIIFVVTNQVKDRWQNDKMIEADALPREQPQQKHWMDYIMHFDLNLRLGKRIATITKCRFFDILKIPDNKRQIDNCTWDKFVASISSLGIGLDVTPAKETEEIGESNDKAEQVSEDNTPKARRDRRRRVREGQE